MQAWSASDNPEQSRAAPPRGGKVDFMQRLRSSAKAAEDRRALPRNRTRTDILVLVVVSVIAGHMATQLDAMESLVQFSARHEQFELDEVFATLIFMTGLLALFAWRRVIELRRHIAARDEAERAMRHLAMHDTLTGLPNRAQLCLRLKQEISRMHRDGGTMAILSLDLDGFKSVNDYYGHGVGDHLLIETSDRLQTSVRDMDAVARLGGDEFIVVLPQIGSPRSAAKTAERIIAALGEPFTIKGYEIAIGVSIGITMANADRADPVKLLRSADLAMYRAKQEGRSRFRFFEPEMNAKLRERRQLEQGLRMALERNGFDIHYQPLYAVPGKSLKGFEALIRWNHPRLGAVSPATFIPIAEEIGLISRIGDWVLYEACRAAVGWPEHLHVAVNVSPLQFKEPDLARRIISIARAAGLPLHRLEIEITESVLLQNSVDTLQILNELKFEGVRISMDDFGTGYSSLSYLRRFPFDKIKIDRCLTEGSNDGGNSDAIVSAIVSMGRSLDMTTLVEGVESANQLERLVRDGCDEAQGFYLGRPMSLSSACGLIEEEQRREPRGHINGTGLREISGQRAASR